MRLDKTEFIEFWSVTDVDKEHARDNETKHLNADIWPAINIFAKFRLKLNTKWDSRRKLQGGKYKWNVKVFTARKEEKRSKQRRWQLSKTTNTFGENEVGVDNIQNFKSIHSDSVFRKVKSKFLLEKSKISHVGIDEM